MKFFNVVAACLSASLALAAQDEQVFTIIDILKSINANATILNNYIQEWNGSVETSGKPLGQVSLLVSQIIAGNKTISKFSPLIETDTLRLEPPVNDLSHTAERVIQSLVDKKVIIFNVTLGPIVHGQVKDTQVAAKALSDTIVGKVPEDLRSVAETLAAGIADNLQSGVNTFNCLTCDAKTGKANTCDPAKNPDSCFSGAGSAVRSLSVAASLSLAAVVCFFLVS